MPEYPEYTVSEIILKLRLGIGNFELQTLRVDFLKLIIVQHLFDKELFWLLAPLVIYA